MITTYTSFDEVRAVLGVSDDELDDTTLGLGVYASALNIAMSEVNDDFATYLTGLKATSSRNAREELFVDYSALFCAYSVASHLCSALPMFGLKDVGDSKATASRFALDPYKATIADVRGRLDVYKNKVIELYNELNPMDATSSPSISFTVMGKSTPTSDPVTGA